MSDRYPLPDAPPGYVFATNNTQAVNALEAQLATALWLHVPPPRRCARAGELRAALALVVLRVKRTPNDVLVRRALKRIPWGDT